MNDSRRRTKHGEDGFCKVQEVMREFQKQKKEVTGVIVFTENSFPSPYDVTGRSYEVSSMAKYFNPSALGNGLVGNCLDGKDDGVRLDYYMGEYGWKPEYCYIV